MRGFFVSLFFLFSVWVSAQNAALNERYSFDHSTISVQELLDDITNRFGLELFYSSTNLDLTQNVKVTYKNITLEELFDKLFFKTRIQFTIHKNKIILKKFDGKLYQNIRGTLIDADNKKPLLFANLACTSCDPQKGTSTDEFGKFILYDVPIGRHTIQVSYLGYRPIKMTEVVVNSAKETVLNLEMEELVTDMEEVLIQPKKEVTKPVNAMATGSVRKFSASEGQRYAAGVSDPARMTQSFPGTIMGSNALFNEVSIRGNSGNKLMWRLEGLEIQSPAHFNRGGSSGGIISMLNSTTMANSDFYSSVFPAEFGNAISGVFDLKLRNGSASKREYEAKIGFLGLEFGTEGPFKKGGDASYLFNYRISNTNLINQFVDLGADYGIPTWSDLSYKLYFPTKKTGVFSVFGLNGIGNVPLKSLIDSSQIEKQFDIYYPSFRRNSFTNGIKHNIILNDKMYWNSTLGHVTNLHEVRTLRIHDQNNYEVGEEFNSAFNSSSYQFNSYLNWKQNKKNTTRLGVNINSEDYQYFANAHFDYQPHAPFLAVDSSVVFMGDTGNQTTSQFFVQHKYKMNQKVTVNAGVNVMTYSFNGETTIDPRLSIEYIGDSGAVWNFGIAKHARKEHLTSTLYRRDGVAGYRDIKIPKVIQVMLSNERKLGKSWYWKNEIYYQYHYDIGVEADSGYAFSMLNMFEVYSLDLHNPIKRFESVGKGRNYGFETSLQKGFDNGYYTLINLSLSRSLFSDRDGNWYPTAWDHQYIAKVVAGKEWSIGPNKKNVFGLNIRTISAGGNWYLDIDYPLSLAIDDQRFDYVDGYDQRGGAINRLDLGINYVVNNTKVTHEFKLDILNANNTVPAIGSEYDNVTNTRETYGMNTGVPFFTYSVKW